MLAIHILTIQVTVSFRSKQSPVMRLLISPASTGCPNSFGGILKVHICFTRFFHILRNPRFSFHCVVLHGTATTQTFLFPARACLPNSISRLIGCRPFYRLSAVVRSAAGRPIGLSTAQPATPAVEGTCSAITSNASSGGQRTRVGDQEGTIDIYQVLGSRDTKMTKAVSSHESI